MLQLDLQSRQPIYEQLIMKLSELISLGVLAPNAQLPSVRALSRDLGVNPNTVQKAYQELERRNVICSIAGKGSFVASGNSANEILTQQSLAKIHDAIDEGKRIGLSHQQVRQVLDEVYEKGVTL